MQLREGLEVGCLWLGFFSFVAFCFGMYNWGKSAANFFGFFAWELRVIYEVIKCR